MTPPDHEPNDDMTSLIEDAMSHPDAGVRLLVMIVLIHASVNDGDPAWNPEFAIHEARTTLEHGDTAFDKIQVSVTLAGQAYRIDPGPIWSASKWPLVHRLIDIALMDALQTRIHLLTCLMAALEEHGDTGVVIDKTDAWFTPAATQKALASMVSIVAAEEQVVQAGGPPGGAGVPITPDPGALPARERTSGRSRQRMNDHLFDRDIDPPEDKGPFMPDPEFYAALGAVVIEGDLDVRFHAASQVILALSDGATKSEAAHNSVELITHILTNALVDNEITLIYGGDGAAIDVDMGEEDNFGDEGATAALILEILTLDDVVARRSALTAFAFQTAAGVDGEAPYLAALTRYIKRSRGEQLLRLV